MRRLIRLGMQEVETSRPDILNQVLSEFKF
jgi:hypothetical protein